MVTMKAYEVKIVGWSGMRQIMAGYNRGHIKSGSLRAARDAGYEMILYTDFRVRRAPQFDANASPHTGLTGPIMLGYHDSDGSCWGVLETTRT